MPCPTAQQGLIHPRMPNATPQHASSWRQPWRRLALALLQGPVHGTHLLTAKGPLHQEMQRDRQAVPNIAGCSQRAPLQQTDRQTHQTWVSAKPSHHQSPLLLLLVLGMFLTLAPCQVGGRWQQHRVALLPSLSLCRQQACAGVRAHSQEARLGSGAAVVVLLRGCQAMASTIAKAVGAAGLNANQGCRSSPGALQQPKPPGAPTLGLKSKWGEERSSF